MCTLAVDRSLLKLKRTDNMESVIALAACWVQFAWPTTHQLMLLYSLLSTFQNMPLSILAQFLQRHFLLMCRRCINTETKGLRRNFRYVSCTTLCAHIFVARVLTLYVHNIQSQFFTWILIQEVHVIKGLTIEGTCAEVGCALQ